MDKKCGACEYICEDYEELSKEDLCDVCQEDLNKTRKQRGDGVNSSHN